LKTELNLRNDRSKNQIIEKIQVMEKNNRLLHKGQQGKILNMQVLVTKVIDLIDSVDWTKIAPKDDKKEGEKGEDDKAK